MLEKKIEELLNENKVRKHYTYEKTGVVAGDCREISGKLKDVDHFYIYPYESEDKQIELCYNNTHYGYAHFGEDGLLYDNRNRGVFEIIVS